MHFCVRVCARVCVRARVCVGQRLCPSKASIFSLSQSNCGPLITQRPSFLLISVHTHSSGLSLTAQTHLPGSTHTNAHTNAHTHTHTHNHTHSNHAPRPTQRNTTQHTTPQKRYGAPPSRDSRVGKAALTGYVSF